MIFLIVLVWGVIGLVGGMVIATELGPLFGFRNMEGSSAIFGVFTGAPLGLAAGAYFGFRRARSYGDDAKKRRRFLLASLGVVAALVAGGVVFEMIRTRDDITSSGGAELPTAPATGRGRAGQGDTGDVRTAQRQGNAPAVLL